MRLDEAPFQKFLDSGDPADWIAALASADAMIEIVADEGAPDPTSRDVRYNPYHDEKGRFSDAPANGTFPPDILDPPLGTNTEVVEKIEALPPDAVIRMYHGTTAVGAASIVDGLLLKPDDVRAVGLASNYEEARKYGLYHTGFGWPKNRDATVVEVAVQRDELGHVEPAFHERWLTEEVGGSGYNSILVSAVVSDWAGVRLIGARVMKRDEGRQPEGRVVDAHGNIHDPHTGEFTHKAGSGWDPATSPLVTAIVSKDNGGEGLSATLTGDRGENLVSMRLAAELGILGKPTVLSADEIQAKVDSGEMELFRGQSRQHADGLREGPDRLSEGMLGSGIYAVAHEEGGAYLSTAVQEAVSYASGIRDHPCVTRMTLKEGTPVIGYRQAMTQMETLRFQLEEERFRIRDAYGERGGVWEKALDRATADREHEAEMERLVARQIIETGDLGRWAMIHGYGAVIDSSMGYMLVVDRRALNIQSNDLGISEAMVAWDAEGRSVSLRIRYPGQPRDEKGQFAESGSSSVPKFATTTAAASWIEETYGQPVTGVEGVPVEAMQGIAEALPIIAAADPAAFAEFRGIVGVPIEGWALVRPLHPASFIVASITDENIVTEVPRPESGMQILLNTNMLDEQWRFSVDKFQHQIDLGETTGIRNGSPAEGILSQVVHEWGHNVDHFYGVKTLDYDQKGTVDYATGESWRLFWGEHPDVTPYGHTSSLENKADGWAQYALGLDTPVAAALREWYSERGQAPVPQSRTVRYPGQPRDDLGRFASDGSAHEAFQLRSLTPWAVPKSFDEAREIAKVKVNEVKDRLWKSFPNATLVLDASFVAYAGSAPKDQDPWDRPGVNPAYQRWAERCADIHLTLEQIADGLTRMASRFPDAAASVKTIGIADGLPGQMGTAYDRTTGDCFVAMDVHALLVENSVSKVAIADSEATGWFLPGTGNWDAVGTHEFGHVLSWSMRDEVQSLIESRGKVPADLTFQWDPTVPHSYADPYHNVTEGWYPSPDAAGGYANYTPAEWWGTHYSAAVCADPSTWDEDTKAVAAFIGGK